MNNKLFSITETAREYTYSKFPLASKKENEKLIEDWVNKIETTKNIVVDFKSRARDPRGMKILDAGSGNGGTCISFAEAGAEVSGIEIEKDLFEISKSFAESRNAKVEFILYDGKKMSFGDNSFDAVLSISVLEHVTDPINYLSEIFRVLKPGGYFYLAFPNRLWPRETHTLLWFVHWLPYKLAEFVTRVLKRNPLPERNLHFYTYWNLKKMLDKLARNGYNFNIKEEKGNSKNIFKQIIKNGLSLLGLSYKVFLPHIQLIIIKK